MAVMGTMRHSIIFGGVNSADFGIYISGEGVFDAPKRAVEMIAVPGRNGEIALDQGYWENIEVTYPAFNYEEDLDTFAERLSAFRNAICSLKGYQRLSDTFHPDEYRMAVYSEGLEVTPIKYNTAANFDLKFNCKPQRWLTSGETAVTVESGDTLTNPTPYDASPLLMIEGYGTINIGDYPVEIVNDTLGTVSLYNSIMTQKAISAATEYSATISTTFSTAELNAGDTEHLEDFSFAVKWDEGSHSMSSFALDTQSGPATFSLATFTPGRYASATFNVSFPNMTAGTAVEKQECYVGGFRYLSGGNTGANFTGYLDVDLTYEKTVNGTEETFTVTITCAIAYEATLIRGNMKGESTILMVGHPAYIDMSTGDAYKEENGEFISLNRYIYLQSDLATLKPGTTEITFDSTITDLKIVPRWWKL